jgi:hypothetical protein
MELTIDPNAELHVEGPVTIELPPWMRMLPPAELAEVKTAANRASLVVAAGRHPMGDIVFLTGDGQLWEIDGETQQESGMPMVNAAVAPIDCGHTLEYVMTGSFEIDIDWALERARGILFFGALSNGPEATRVRYVDE